MRETYTEGEVDVVAEVLTDLQKKMADNVTGYGARLLIDNMINEVCERMEQ